MSKDREEELPGNVHGPRISCPLSATSTKYSLTDGRDEDLGSCKDVTVRIQSIVSGAPTFTIGMMFSIAVTVNSRVKLSGPHIQKRSWE